jgi:hypothetical protein
MSDCGSPGGSIGGFDGDFDGGFDSNLNGTSRPRVRDYRGPAEQKSSKTAPELTII